MPDIAMCHGDGCPRKHACYRQRAIPTPHRQSYFLTPPVRSDGTCAHFTALRAGDALAVAEPVPEDPS